MSSSIELLTFLRGLGVAFINDNAVALTTKVAQSTPIARLVLNAASIPPTAGPIMLPTKLLAKGRTAFIAGKRSTGTISGVRAEIAGKKTASKEPKRKAK